MFIRDRSEEAEAWGPKQGNLWHAFLCTWAFFLPIFSSPSAYPPTSTLLWVVRGHLVKLMCYWPLHTHLILLKQTLHVWKSQFLVLICSHMQSLLWGGFIKIKVNFFCHVVMFKLRSSYRTQVRITLSWEPNFPSHYDPHQYSMNSIERCAWAFFQVRSMN